MCGIAGFIDLERRSDVARLRRIGWAMSDALRHRGPDAGDVWADATAGITMGFRRLAIIDPSPAGHQPMTSADGRWVLTYNGEIYNYRDLTRELTERGHRFRGASDTEVLLELFARDGVEATLPRLIGMFAVALWDKAERRLWLIRDRLGIKPLYYGRQGAGIYWASELKAIRAHPDFEARVDLSAVDGFLKANAMAAPSCIYADIDALRPGEIAVVSDDGVVGRWIYWSMAEIASHPIADLPVEAALDRTETLLADAVERRMVSDVPLGALLSGGIDSSTVAALMQRASDRSIKTFTIGFASAKYADYDEAAHAAAVAGHLGTDHTSLELSPDNARELVPDMPDRFDEPFADSSALPTYLVCRLAREQVTVVLSGDGGDEAFFGYNRHRALARMANTIDAIPGPARRLIAAAIATPGPALWDGLTRLLPRRGRPRMVGVKMAKLARFLAIDDPDARYLDLVTHWPEDLTGLQITPTMPEGVPDLDPAARAAWADTVAYLPNGILTKVDRASMAVGLEARVPLLDHRLIEFAWTLPTELKIRGGVSKWPLRQLLYRHVPKRLVDRPKAGFTIPLADWLRGPLRDWAETWLAENRLRKRGWLDPAPVRAAWNQLLGGRGERRDEALWGICMLEAWADRWIGNP